MFKNTGKDLLDLSDLCLDQATLDTIQKKVIAVFQDNKVEVVKIVSFAQNLFCKLYSLLIKLENVTTDNLCVYLKLFSMTTSNQ